MHHSNGSLVEMRVCHMTRDVRSDLSRHLTVTTSQMTALQKNCNVVESVKQEDCDKNREYFDIEPNFEARSRVILPQVLVLIRKFKKVTYFYRIKNR